MTTRQKILKLLYPAMMWFTRNTGTNTVSLHNPGVHPLVSFYNLPATKIDGKPLDLSVFRGKKLLLVNTASDCGYTGQYEGLEKLYRLYKDQLVVIGIPANDFKDQEKEPDEKIAAFCQLNYGVSFPLLQKCRVIKGEGQNEIFQWLSNKNLNGWNNRDPTWNFCKYLLDEEGRLLDFFASSIQPMDSVVVNALQQSPHSRYR